MPLDFRPTTATARSWLVALFALGCGGGPPEITCLYDCVAEPALAEGDPEVGEGYILDQGFATCGVPTRLFDLSAELLGDRTLLDDRTGTNERLDFRYTASTSPRGEEVVNVNCLNCHGDLRNGELVIGAPNVTKVSGDTDEITLSLLKLAAETDAERAELDVLIDIAAVTDRYASPVVGVSVGASSLMAIAAHRDPETMAWSDEPHMAEPPEDPPLIDPPPWWNMRKKHAMFANTAGRGDWAIMAMNAGIACAETAELAERVEEMAPHVRAWIQSLEAPEYPFAVDEDLARDGERVFEDTCARCHGLYADDPDEEVYPNVVVPIDVVGTDPAEASVAEVWQGAWDGFFGRNLWGGAVDWAPQEGYVAPPLDGLWASAPYFHNGAVPTVAGVIDSARRPTMWRRTSLDSTDLDPDEIGWRYEVVGGTLEEVDELERVYVYDTSQDRQLATGHTFGDALDDDEREALLEYLKTL